MNVTRLQYLSWIRLLFALVLVLSPISAYAAAPTATLAQVEDGIPILLGEYVQLGMSAGDVVTYTIYIPESGIYMITPDDDEAAAAFDIAVYSEDSDIFEGMLLDASELELSEGVHYLEVTAVEEGVLSFFVLGMIGAMSDSSRQPGKLYPGSLYMEDNVSDERYATLSVPDVGYPQQVLLYVETNEEDTVTVYAEGEDIGYRTISSHENNLLSFWTEGGDYLISVEPWERRSEFSLIVFLSGSPTELALDEPFEASLAQGADQLVYALNLDTFYDEVAVELESSSEDEPLEILVVDRLYGGELEFYGYDDDGAQVVEMENLFPGTYYVVVSRYSVEADVDFTLLASGEEGDPLTLLASGETIEGEIASGESTFYEFEVSETGALVTVDLFSDAEDADFDLSVGTNLQELQWSSATTGANEQVQFMAPVAGTYYIQVQSYSGEGIYELTAEEGDLATELIPGEVLEDGVDDDGRAVYRLVVDEPGQILSVLLVGGEESDLDLAVNLYSNTGEWIDGLSSTTLGSAEIVSKAAAQMGVYEVSVRAYGTGDDFRLLAQLDNPADLMDAAMEE